MKHLPAIGLGILVFAGPACSIHYIRGTRIADSRENREVIQVLEQYRRTLEARDVEGLLALASTDFQEAGGTPDPADDYNYATLREKLTVDFSHLEQIQVQLEPRKIEINDQEATVYYRLLSNYLTRMNTGANWHSKSDDTRMVFRRQGGTWKILRGL